MNIMVGVWNTWTHRKKISELEKKVEKTKERWMKLNGNHYTANQS